MSNERHVQQHWLVPGQSTPTPAAYAGRTDDADADGDKVDHDGNYGPVDPVHD